MAAFDRAVAMGYRYLETDVQVTSDGVALAFHDARLDRVTDCRGRVSEMPWSVVRSARIRGREPIPRLDELLDAWPQTRINLDIKAKAGVTPVLEAITRTAAIDRVCIASFSGARLRAVRARVGPRLCTALTPREVLALRLALVRGHAARLPANAACAQVPSHIGRRRFVDRRFIAAAHRSQVAVHVWTVNDPAEMHRLLDLGVDGLITDEAELLRDILAARAQWGDEV